MENDGWMEVLVMLDVEMGVVVHLHGFVEIVDLNGVVVLLI